MSRRRFLAGDAGSALVGLFGRVHGTAAQGGPTGPTPQRIQGQGCTRTDECCSYAGTAVICADNGVTGLACVAGEGGCCGSDAQCASALLCRGNGDERCNSTCVNPSTVAPTQPLSLGAPCTSTDQCANTFGGQGYCDTNGIEDDGPLNCCRYDGGLCSDDRECCGVALCVSGASIYGGVCRTAGSQGDGSLLPPGAMCTSDAICDQSGGTTFCLSNGIGVDGEANCCRLAGGSCTSGAGCCNSLLCVGSVCQ